MDDTVIRSSRGQIKVVSEDPAFKLNDELIANLERALQHVDPGDTDSVATHINGRLPTSHTIDRVIREDSDLEAPTAYIRRKNGI
jgi:hypothetical protein